MPAAPGFLNHFMKAIHLLLGVIVVVTWSAEAFCQTNSISVDYLCKVNSLKTGINKKIAIKRMIYTDDTSYVEEDSILQDKLLSHVSFEQNKTIRAFANCSYTIFDDDSPAGITIHTPDTLKFCGGQWTSVIKSGYKHIPAKKTMVKSTGQHKMILGLLCDKFLVNDVDSGNNYFVWANNTLPKTLIPVTGLTGFRYGILEVQAIDDTWSITATHIERLK